LAFAAPLFLIGLAAVFLHEKVGPYRIGAVVVGFLGVLLVAQPHVMAGGGGPLKGPASRFLSPPFISFSRLFLRALGTTENSLATVFYFTLTTTLVSALTLPFGFVPPGPGDLALFVAAGLTGGVMQFINTMAYRYADASALAPFDYVQLPFAMLI